jgi:hypothetical protein
MQGGAVYTAAFSDLTLESCIFSGNKTIGASADGGAVYASGNLTVLGCTFYGNSAGNRGGAIFRNGTGFALTLTGNIFWGNTAPTYPVLYTSSATGFASGGFNVSDKATGTSASGWAFANGDKQAASQPLSSVSFRPIGGGEALGVITARPQGYPEKDFQGESIPGTGAAAGAVQTAAGTGFVLDYAALGTGVVTVSGADPDADGLLNSGATVTLTASDGEFGHWTINGAVQPEQSPPEELVLSMDAHKTVRAVFLYISVTTTGDSGPGSLRQALADSLDGGRIGLPAGQTITLTSARLAADKNLIIEGNGATLTQDGFTASRTSQLLHIASGKEVRISRLRFTGGRATDYGGAINNVGKLTLESCILSDNEATDSMAFGGAIYTGSNTLTVLGCTFYANKAPKGQGGAIYKGSGTLALTGNVFFGNTASSSPVVSTSSGLTSGGFNVSNNSASGWTFTATDVHLQDLDVDSDAFQPSSASLPVIASLPAGFPSVYFDGTVRETSGAASAPGAMPAALAAE